MGDWFSASEKSKSTPIRSKLPPRELIFDDDDIEAAQAMRKSVVAKAQRSKSAKQKDATRRTPEGLPVQSFQDLL